MGEYANAFFQGFNLSKGIDDAKRQEDAAAQVLAKVGETGSLLSEIKTKTTVGRQRKDAVAGAAALPIGSDTPVAAIPTLTAANDMGANADVAGGAIPVAPVAAAPPAAVAPVAAPAATGALPVAPAAPAAPTTAASPVDPNAPIVGADSDDLAALKPAALNFAELGGLLARGGFTPEQATGLLQQFNSVGNALAEQYLTIAAVRYGSAEGGNALSALMEANDPDGNYRTTFQDGKYVVVDTSGEGDPASNSFVFDQSQVEQFLAQATAGNSPILAYNKGATELAIRESTAKTAQTVAQTAAARGETYDRSVTEASADRKAALELKQRQLDAAIEQARLNYGLKVNAAQLADKRVQAAIEKGTAFGMKLEDSILMGLTTAKIPELDDVPQNNLFSAITKMMAANKKMTPQQAAEALRKFHVANPGTALG
jgi:hypothetical protein